MGSATEEEIKAFHEDSATPDFSEYTANKHRALPGLKPRPAQKPLFGEGFKQHMMRRLEAETDASQARQTYEAIEQETVTYVANFIKDSIVALFKKAKRG